MYWIVGLGNPGEEYEATRHNTGRIVLAYFLKKQHLPEPIESKKYASLVSEGDCGGEDVFVLWPETYMNKSGSAVAKAISSAKKAKNLIVVYDDLDLPLGTMKISFGRGSGGHKGVESIIKALKTRDFIRIRVGIAPTTPSGKLKKPKDEEKIIDFLMGEFKKPEQEALKKISKQVGEAIETILTDGLQKAMNQFN
ncbi:aminoacyl-tRNA hydrolase [Candidatus Kaiserbacteria bacterium]|nr:aminoacyl-tRNA hydrolase [Candidatus Kaiserbacteria bacterium]